MSEEQALKTPRAVLEALASTAITESMEPEQTAYEKWLDNVDYQGPWPQISWDDLSSEAQAQWRVKVHVECHEPVLTSDSAASESDEKESTPTRAAPIRRTREWFASSNGDPEVKNRPKCPLCTSLKKSIPCKGGPPCSECKRKGYTASECQNYIPGLGNKGRRRVLLDGGDRPRKRLRVRSKPEKPKEQHFERREQFPSLLVGEGTPPQDKRVQEDDEP